MFNNDNFPDDRFERELAAYEREQEEAEEWANTIHSSDFGLLEMGAEYIYDYYLDNEEFWYQEDSELTERIFEEKELWSIFEKVFQKIEKNFYRNGNDDWAGSISSYVVAVEIFINELKEIGFPVNLQSIHKQGEDLQKRLLQNEICAECGQEDWSETQKRFLVEILAEAEANCYTIDGIDWEIRMIREGKEFPKPFLWHLSPKCSVHNPEREQKEQELRSRSGVSSRKGEGNA